MIEPFGKKRQTRCPKCGTRIVYFTSMLMRTTLDEIHAECHVCKAKERLPT